MDEPRFKALTFDSCGPKLLSGAATYRAVLRRQFVTAFSICLRRFHTYRQ